jgi:hypothetical protein
MNGALGFLGSHWLASAKQASACSLAAMHKSYLVYG